MAKHSFPAGLRSLYANPPLPSTYSKVDEAQPYITAIRQSLDYGSPPAESATPTPTCQKVLLLLEKIAHTISEKNALYGDSYANPKMVFSKATATERLACRIDEKLSRIAECGFRTADEDTLVDLIAQLAFLAVLRDNESSSD